MIESAHLVLDHLVTRELHRCIQAGSMVSTDRREDFEDKDNGEGRRLVTVPPGSRTECLIHIPLQNPVTTVRSLETIEGLLAGGRIWLAASSDDRSGAKVPRSHCR